MQKGTAKLYIRAPVNWVEAGLLGRVNDKRGMWREVAATKVSPVPAHEHLLSPSMDARCLTSSIRFRPHPATCLWPR